VRDEGKPHHHSVRGLAQGSGAVLRRVRKPVHLGTQFPSGDHESARAGSPSRWPRPYLLYLGGFSHRKNVSTVLQAFARITEPFPQVDLLLAGSPPPAEKRTLLRIARDLNLGERVVWLGYVAPDDLPGLYAWSEGFVYPSLYEGFGLPVLEAMQFGAPVITTRKGSIPEVMGDIGLAVDPGSPAQVADAMAALLSDPGLLQRLRRDGQRRASEFSWERCAEETAAVYTQVLAQRADARTGAPT
jgi:glycosyltransferase involved in cell wall biosynthesis